MECINIRVITNVKKSSRARVQILPKPFDPLDYYYTQKMFAEFTNRRPSLERSWKRNIIRERSWKRFTREHSWKHFTLRSATLLECYWKRVFESVSLSEIGVKLGVPY